MRASVARAVIDVARRPTFLAASAYLAVAFCLTGPALVGREDLGPYVAMDCCDAMYKLSPPPPRPSFDDPTAVVQDYPRERLFARGLSHGRVTGWNPYAGAGSPLWAEQGGPFFPLKLPFYLSPNLTGLYLFLTLRLVAGALGAMFLARARGRGTAAAFAAGLLFEVSGTMVAQLSFVVASAICVLPWAAFGAQKLAAGAWRAGVAVSAVALGLAFHGGHPTIALMVWLGFGVAAAMHAVRELVSRRRAQAGRIVAGAAAAVVLGAALAAPVVLPLRELNAEALSYKVTTTGDWAYESTRDKNQLMLPVSLLAPSLYHEYRKANKWLWPWPFSPAIGVLTFVLALAALPFAVDWALAGMAVLGVILSTGPPGFGWVHDLPWVGYILPFYGWALLVLPLTQAAAHMVELLADRRARIAAVVSLATVALAAAIVVPQLRHMGLPSISAGKIYTRAIADPLVVALIFLPFAVSGLTLALTCLAWRRRGAGLALGLVAAAEALSNDVRMIGEQRSRVVEAPPPPPVRFLQDALADGQGRVHAVPFLVARPNTLAIWDVPDVRYSGPLPLERLTDYFAAIRPLDRYFVMHYPATVSSPLLDRAAVRFVVLTPQDRGADSDPQLAKEYSDGNVVIYRNLAALPRARVVHDVVPVIDRDRALVHMRGLAARGGHGPAPVALEPSADGRVAVGTPSPPPNSVEGARIVDAHDPDRVAIAAELAAPGYVLLADSYARGWSATVDGAPAPIHPADLLFRAVAVPAGAHEVVFEYRTPSLRLGFAMCVAGLLGVVIIATWRRRTPA